MLGTADKPGPMTSLLNASREQMEQWNAINKTGLTPDAQASLGTWNPDVPGSTSSYINKLDPTTGQYTPTANPNVAAPVPVEQSAAQGGLMGLRGYASGGDLQKAAKAAWGRDLTASELALWTQYQSNTPYDTVLSRMQGYPEGVQYAASEAALSPEQKVASYQKKVDAGETLTGAQNTMLSNFNTYKTQIKAGTIKLDASGNPAPVIKQGATKAETDAANAAFTKATGIQPPTGKAPYSLTDTFKTIANVDPKTLKSTDPAVLAALNKAANLKDPTQFATATDMYGKSTKGLEAAAKYKPTDVSAKKADVASATSQGYTAANATSEGYDASNMVAPDDISAQKADVATMQGAADVNATPLTQYQMQGPRDINAATAGTAQMQGPQSWLDQGTSQAYMNPYQQNVIDIQKREANRDYQQQLNQLNAQSVKSGAFGGSRQAIQQSEAARNQNMLLNDIQAKGSQEAYTQGAQQFNTAQGQQLQAGQANLEASQQSILANQAAQIQAMMANQGMDYNTAFQNLQARVGIQNTASSQELQAAVSNQNVQQQTQSTNMEAQNQANNAYVQNALDAAKVNYGGQLTAAQANQVSENAAAQFAANAANLTSQFNATNQNQASQFTSGAQNTANLANQQAANTANNAYTQQQLAALQGNQQAGLTANQQGIGALQGIGQNASGVAATGTAQNQATLANLGAQGQAANAGQNLAQSVLDAQSGNAQNWHIMPSTITGGSINAAGGQNVQGGSGTTTSSNMPAKSWARGGLIKNGKVSNRGKK
jgi:hypothetical protein